MLLSATASILLAGLPPLPPGLWAARSLGCAFDVRHPVAMSAEGLELREQALDPPVVRLYAGIASREGTARRQDDSRATPLVVRQAILGLVLADDGDGAFGTTTTIYDTAATRTLRPGQFPAVRHTHLQQAGYPVPVLETGWCRVVG